MIAPFLLILTGIYLICGFVFAIPFAFMGVGKIDPHAAHGTWGFRLLIMPGTILLWPLLARRWFKGVHEPPEERNAHRLRAKCTGQNSECGQTKAAPPSTLHSTL